MTFKHKINEPSTLIRIGSASLLLASLAKWFVHPEAAPVRDLTDGIMGLLFGVAIATLLLAARLNARRSSGTGNRPCV